MSSQSSWYIENCIILVANEGTTTDQELFNVDQQIVNYMNQATAPLVHVIVDNRKLTVLPSVKAFTQLTFPKHSQCGWVLVVGPANTLIRFINLIVTNVSQTRNRMFNTLDEALDFLNEIDSTLPALRVVAPQ